MCAYDLQKLEDAQVRFTLGKGRTRHYHHIIQRVNVVVPYIYIYYIHIGCLLANKTGREFCFWDCFRTRSS